MIKIGIVDYFLDNFHGGNYPKWISNYSENTIEVTCAYAKIDHPAGGMTSLEWSKKHGIPLYSSIEEVVEKSDCIMVLAPSHSETHEELSQIPLRSGKPVFVDKAFAPDLETAKRMFALAEAHNTPCCSASALAFVAEYQKINRAGIQTISSRSAGTFEVYCIHQFEPVIAMMGANPVGVMSIGDAQYPSFLIQFEDGRCAKTEHFNVAPFEVYVGYEDGNAICVRAEDDVFCRFVHQLLKYFETGTPLIEASQTLRVIAALDAAKKAILSPHTMIPVVM